MVPDKYLSFWLGLQQVRPKNPRSKHDGPETSRNQPTVQVPGFALQTPSSGTAVHKSLLFFSYTATSPNIKKPNGIERDRKISLHDSGVATLSRDVKSKLVQVSSPNQIDAGIKV